MGSLTKRHKLMGLSFALVFTFGIVVNLRGQIGPLIQQDLNLSYSKFGFALSFFSIGGILFNLLGGLLIEKIGLKKVLLAGLIISGLGLLAINYSLTYIILILAMIVLGTGVTLLNLTATSLISTLSRQGKGKMMNFFHFFFGVGGVIAPIYANQILDLGFSWRATYLFAGILILIFLFISLLLDFPADKKIAESKDLSQVKDVIKEPKVIVFILLFLFYCGAELGIASWLSLYLTDVQNRDQAEIRFFLSTFFFLFTFGRLIAGQLVEKIGYLLWILIATITTVVLILAAMLGPNSWAILFSLTGLTLAGIFPTLQAIMFENFCQESISVVLGITLTAASVGFMIIGDWLVGYINDLVGIALGFGIVIIYLLIFLVIFICSAKKYLNS